MASELDGPAHLEQNPIGDEGSVVVEVTLKVAVRKDDWLAEYSVEGVEGVDYDFEEMFRDQFSADVQEYFVEQGEMQNVTEVNLA